MPARVEEPRELPRPRVDTGQVRPFMEVVLVAAESQVAGVISTLVLLGDDMLDVKREEGIVVLVQPAVFAAPIGSSPYQFSGGGADHDGFARRARAFAWRIATIFAAMT